MTTTTNINTREKILNIFTFFEEYIPPLYNEFKNEEKQRNGFKNQLQLEKLFTISRKLSKANSDSMNICQKN